MLEAGSIDEVKYVGRSGEWLEWWWWFDESDI